MFGGIENFNGKYRYPAMMPVQQSGCERGDGGGFGDRGVDGVVGVYLFVVVFLCKLSCKLSFLLLGIGKIPRVKYIAKYIFK